MAVLAESDEALNERIAMAEAAVAALADQFLPEVRGQVAEMTVLTEEARAAQPVNGPVTAKIFHIAHNVKGLGGSFEFDLITDVGGSLCELTRVDDETGYGPDLDDRALDVVGHHLRVLTTIIDRNIRGDGGDLGRQLVGRLQQLREGLEPPAQA